MRANPLYKATIRHFVLLCFVLINWVLLNLLCVWLGLVLERYQSFLFKICFTPNAGLIDLDPKRFIRPFKEDRRERRLLSASLFSSGVRDIMSLVSFFFFCYAPYCSFRSYSSFRCVRSCFHCSFRSPFHFVLLLPLSFLLLSPPPHSSRSDCLHSFFLSFLSSFLPFFALI